MDAKAAGAYVTLSIREDMKAGIAQAQAKISAFADYAAKKTSNILDFGKFGNFLVSGAVVGMLSKIAMENENIAASAQKAQEQFNLMFNTMLNENAGAINQAFEVLSFILNKLINGFRAIIALVQDFGDVITATSFGFDNFNKVLDTLDPEPMAKQAENTGKLASQLKLAAIGTRQLTEAQRELNAANAAAQTAGMSDINRLIREQEVGKRGETAVRADEIYKEALDAQLRLVDAQNIMNLDERKAAVDRAHSIAEARREQFLFLEDQKKAREEMMKAQEQQLENEAKIREEAAKVAEERQRELEAKRAGTRTAGVSGTFAIAAAGGNVQYQTQKDMLREIREQKALQRQQLEAQREANRRPGARFA
jgi:hypothetical protein